MNKTTSTAVVPFQFDSLSIRTVLDEHQQPLFVAADVAAALGYKNTNDAIAAHCKGVAKRYPLRTNGGSQEVRVIYEPDLYRLIIGSKLPAAQKFEKWIFEEVLPTIRKKGGYQQPESPAKEPAQQKDHAKLIAHASVITPDGRTLLALTRLLGFHGLQHTSHRHKVTSSNLKALRVEKVLCRVPGERFTRLRDCIPADKLDLFLRLNYLDGMMPVVQDQAKAMREQDEQKTTGGDLLHAVRESQKLLEEMSQKLDNMQARADRHLKSVQAAPMDGDERFILDKLKRARFMVSFDDKQEMQVKFIPGGMVVRAEDLPKVVGDPDYMVPRELLPQIIQAASNRLVVYSGK